MNEYVQVLEPGVIQIQRLLDGPIERVWSYLVESDKRGQWLASGDLEQWVGGKVIHEFQHSNLSEEPDEIPEKYCDLEGGEYMEGTVTKIDPPRLLAYTWDENATARSEVTFELVEQDGKVLLTLTHRALPESEFVPVSAGWHNHLDILADRLAGRPTRAFWKTHMELEKEYEKRYK